MTPDFTVLACCTDEALFEKNLNSSRLILDGKMKLRTAWGVQAVPRALNELAEISDTEYVVFTHQDVWFPGNWLEDACKRIDDLRFHDDEWGMFGPAGAVWTPSYEDKWRYGHLYENGVIWGGMLQPLGNGYMEVETLDECCIVADRERFLEAGGFTDTNPGRHFYGADLCFKSPYTAYVVDLPIHHNTQTKRAEMDAEFMFCAGWMWAEYRDLVPFATTCCRVYDKNGVMQMEV